jgi:hypothetical protein
MVPFEHFRRPDDGHEDFFIIAQVAFIIVFVHNGYIFYIIAAKKSNID